MRIAVNLTHLTLEVWVGAITRKSSETQNYRASSAGSRRSYIVGG
jgi:hypothetical protein